MVGCTADEMRHKGNPIPKMDVLARMAEAYEEDNKEYLKVIDPHKPAYCAQFFENRMGDDMLAGDIAWCENQLALGRKPAYAYYFTYVPPGAEASSGDRGRAKSTHLAPRSSREARWAPPSRDLFST